jgi:hypothetical protein
MLRWQVMELPSQSPSRTRGALPAGLELAINLMLRTGLHPIPSCLRGQRETGWRARGEGRKGKEASKPLTCVQPSRSSQNVVFTGPEKPI